MVMEGLQEDMGDGSMQCTDHPYKNNTPGGGICAFCLQEKLGKLVSSSFPVAVFPSSSSSSSPSDFSTSGTTTSIVSVRPNPSSSSNTHNLSKQNDCYYHQYQLRKSRLPFILNQKKNKKETGVMSTSDQTSIIFKRSKSSVTPRRGVHFLESNYSDDLSPNKRRFWSFLYLTKHSTSKRSNVKEICYAASSSSAMESDIRASNIGSLSQQRSREREKKEDNESPDQVSFDRKVSRSRSVGCGSRSFSGDFFERISTGFGDCTLRRVESQREGKSRVRHGVAGGNGGQDCIKERVKCGGIFSGFMITSSSSSSSSSSYWVSSSTEDTGNAKPSTAAAHLTHDRSKSWSWAFASPMRAFSKPSGKRDDAAAAAANKNDTPNLSAIPSLLAVRS